jgi:hypothetical protein
MTGWAAAKAATAPFLSLASMALTTLRRALRTMERALTLRRRRCSDWRARFFADLMLAKVELRNCFGLEKDGEYDFNLPLGQAVGPFWRVAVAHFRLFRPRSPKMAQHQLRETIAMSLGGLRKLLFIHGMATLAAAIGLTVSPAAIPAVAGIHLEPGSYLLAYLLAGAEFGLSFLSFGGSRLSNAQALRLIAYSCIVFHGTSVLLEIYVAARQPGNGVLWINIAVRIVVIALFAFLSSKGKERATAS